MKNPLGIEVFTGFGIKYPEFEVICPQSLLSYTLRSMTVQDEEALKGSMVTASKLPRVLAQTLWNCCVTKPEGVTTFEEFLQTTTMRDRNALLHGLYNITYKDTMPYQVTCSCENVTKVDVDINKSLKVVMWPGEKMEVITKTVPVELKTFNGVTVTLRQPTMQDEVRVSEESIFLSKNIQDQKFASMMICKIEWTNKDGPQIISDSTNIATAFGTLPASDKNLIESRFQEEFGKYQATVHANVTCSKCDKALEVEIDFLSQFFRTLLAG